MARKILEQFDRDKYKNLIHHVIWKTQNRDGWGMVKLFKALWFFEAKRYSIAREKFSNAVYVRDSFGPRPKLAYQLLASLEADGRIQRYKEPHYSFSLERARSVRPPAPGLLNAEQARDLDFWIDYIDGKTAGEISEETHDYGWEIAKQGEELPLFAFLAHRLREPDAEEMEWAKQNARDLGLP